MNSTAELYREAIGRGLRLESRGDKLAVLPAARCPPEFAAVLRQHKQELLDFLDARATNLAPDCGPWLHIARQVLAGEFHGATGSMRDSLAVGLRNIPHPLCRRAIETLAASEKQSIRLPFNGDK